MKENNNVWDLNAPVNVNSIGNFHMIKFVKLCAAKTKNTYLYLRNFLLFMGFLLKNDKEISAVSSGKMHVAILVTRWRSHTLVYFNIAIALLLKFSGHIPIIIYDDVPCKLTGRNIIIELEMFFLLQILRGVRVIYLSKLRDLELGAPDMSEFKIISRLNTYYKEKTTVPTATSKATSDNFENDFLLVAPKINRLFSLKEFETLIIPGGVYGNTGLYIYFGNKHNVRVASFDSGPGTLIVGVDNVAGYLKDIPKIFSDINDIRDFKKEIYIAKDEFEKRLYGNDLWQYQPVPFSRESSGEFFDVLIPLNVEIDTASLVRSSNFENMYYWLSETADFLLENTNARIAIKEHPSIYNRTDFLKNKMLEQLGSNPRVKYFSRDDNVNTYQLVDRSKVILPYTSTVGIEAAIMGKTVIVESGVYYSDLAFVIKADSKKDYFNSILQFIETDRELSEEGRELALLCYYFTQKCNFLNTHFTPQPDEFLKWSNRTIKELLEDEKVKIILSSFLTGKPLAWLNHVNFISKY